MVVANFDFIAPFYDTLVRVIFGQNLWKAQKTHLKEVRPGYSVLVLGGGTGRMLGWLPKGCEVTYLELSSKMIEYAKKRGEARFINDDFLTHQFNERFDWIVCPFFLDCFEKVTLEVVLQKIQSTLTDKGRIIVTDFHISNWRQKGISNAIIRFFKWTADLPASQLLPIQEAVAEADFTLIKSESFLNDFIFSDIYKKKETF